MWNLSPFQKRLIPLLHLVVHMIGVMSVFAQLERETITERLRSGRLKMVRDEGLWAGGADTSPYGYTRLKRGELIVNEEERQHIVRIFEEYITLKSYIKVQKKLEKKVSPQLTTATYYITP